MLLFLENLRSDWNMALLDENGEVLVSISKPRETAFVQGCEEILKEKNLSTEDISEIIAINGPGSFMQIRAVSVFVNTWAAFAKKTPTIFSIPSGAFLQALFPTAKKLFLGAGLRDFFLFSSNSPERFEKIAKEHFPKTSEEGREYGGIAKEAFFLGIKEEIQKSLLLPVSFETAVKTLFSLRARYQIASFSPEYGAEPSIGKKASSSIK